MQKIEKMTDEEVLAAYEEAIAQDSFEQHSGLMWCSKRKAEEYGF